MRSTSTPWRTSLGVYSNYKTSLSPCNPWPCLIPNPYTSHLMATTFTHDLFQSCFQNWVDQQYQDLDELLNALSNNTTNTSEKLKVLGDKAIKHFEEYYNRRAVMSQHNPPAFLSPPWCSSFENAFLWIGGCRPSLSVRLVYSMCGLEVKDQLEDILSGKRKGNLAEISSEQLDKINPLHCRTVREEEDLSAWMASLQDNIADEPLATIAKQASRIGESSQAVDRAMDAHSESLARLLGDADRLRLCTLKDLMHILTPSQAADLLVASKKLHLSVHEWGKRRDQLSGKPKSG